MARIHAAFRVNTGGRRGYGLKLPIKCRVRHITCDILTKYGSKKEIFCERTQPFEWTTWPVAPVTLVHDAASLSVWFPTVQDHYVDSQRRERNIKWHGVVSQKNISSAPLRNPTNSQYTADHELRNRKPPQKNSALLTRYCRLFQPSRMWRT